MTRHPMIVRMAGQRVVDERMEGNRIVTIVRNVGVDNEGRWWEFSTRHVTTESGMWFSGQPFDFTPTPPAVPDEREGG